MTLDELSDRLRRYDIAPPFDRPGSAADLARAALIVCHDDLVRLRPALGPLVDALIVVIEDANRGD
jgi:hypothetical protein